MSKQEEQAIPGLEDAMPPKTKRFTQSIMLDNGDISIMCPSVLSARDFEDVEKFIEVARSQIGRCVRK